MSCHLTSQRTGHRAARRAAWRAGRPDSGQTSVEFMGMLVALVAVVVAVAAIGLNATISTTIQKAICTIAGISCSSTTESHVPVTACETLNNTGEIKADVVAFSVLVGGTGKYVLSRTVDAQGKEHWYVTLQGEARLGADALFGEDAHLGDLGEGVSAEVKAVLKGAYGEKYEFGSENAARDFITDAEYELGKDAATGWMDPFGIGHAVLDKVLGHEFHPPAPVQYIYEGGGQVDASVDAAAGVGSVGANGNASAVLGVKVDPQKDGSKPHRTVYLRVSAEVAANLGVFEAVKGQAGVSNEVVIGLEYDGDGVPITATLSATGTLKAQLTGSIPGVKGNLGSFLGRNPQGTPIFNDKVGGATTATAAFRLDLTQGNNRDVLADSLHSLGIPVLTGSGTGLVDPVTGVSNLYNLFDSGAPGTQLTVTSYDTDSGDTTLGVKGGDILAFGAEGGVSYENRQITGGSYYDPRYGFVQWQQCGK